MTHFGLKCIFSVLLVGKTSSKITECVIGRPKFFKKSKCKKFYNKKCDIWSYFQKKPKFRHLIWQFWPKNSPQALKFNQNGEN